MEDETRIKKYREKPRPIQAVRWSGTNALEVESLLVGTDIPPVFGRGADQLVSFPVLGGTLIAERGDYIVRSGDALEVLSADAFAAKYEPFCPIQRPRAL